MFTISAHGDLLFQPETRIFNYGAHGYADFPAALWLYLAQRGTNHFAGSPAVDGHGSEEYFAGALSVVRRVSWPLAAEDFRSHALSLGGAADEGPGYVWTINTAGGCATDTLELLSYTEGPPRRATNVVWTADATGVARVLDAYTDFMRADRRPCALTRLVEALAHELGMIDVTLDVTLGK